MRGESRTTIRIGVIGAGQFAQGILLPKLQKTAGVEIVGIATGTGVTARAVAGKYNCEFCTSDYREILGRSDIDAVLVATRHNLHATMVVDALVAGKHVFVEKPLAITDPDLLAVASAYDAAGSRGDARPPVLMVGYNRRFSPLATQLKKDVNRHQPGPMVVNYRVNAGPVPGTNWIQDPVIGGGRIVGEVCHFVDFMQFLTDSEPTEVFATALGSVQEVPTDPDNLCIQLRFADGSLGLITYVANSDPTFPKERIEVFGRGLAGVIDNWRQLFISGHGQRLNARKWLSSAKGHAEELAAFVEGVRSGKSPITFESLVLTTQTTFAIRHSLRTGVPVFVVAHDDDEWNTKEGADARRDEEAQA